MPPLWLLDVDGTVNCFPAPTFDQLMASQDWRDAPMGRYKLWWSQPVVDFINHAHESGLAEVVWLTTWEERAATEVAPAMGLGSFAHAPRGTGGNAPDSSWWKLHWVLEGPPTEGRPFLWTDDDLTEEVRAVTGERFGDRCRLHRPEGNPGLTAEDLPLLEQYLRELGGVGRG